MADVSGFTALSERYNNTGKGGTYRLTVTLNTYLGSLIELIYSHGGDVLKFAGDAFLAVWKTDKRCFLSHTIHTVIACALIIQHSYGSYETDVKVNLKVKLAISAGNLIFAPIGKGIDMNYVIFGLPVLEAKKAESVCSSGEVKVTQTAWGHCYSRNYDHVVHEDGHVTIKSILYDPREKEVNKPFQGFGNLLRQVKNKFPGIEDSDILWDSEISLNISENLRRKEALHIRGTILEVEKKDVGADIRKFMIRPVLTQVDAHQPLEYLTEMRQVSILFMTLKPRDCPFLQLITIVNNSYQITCDMVYKSMGCVNKIILFDKDVMILVVFGLRGFKHESEAQAALKCAYGIKKAVSTLDGVQEVSIGVTTGQVYSGVVGHPLRREFTVIGATVNKAARLMCNFRNKISCDEATFVKSKMSTNGFTLQPATELKGIIEPGKIYEYTEEIRVKQLHDIPMIPPLLNRHDEMEYFENWLDHSHKSFRDYDGILLIGESRIGKSRLLEWMARYARNKTYNVCYVSLTSIHSATPYLALSQIIDQILGLGQTEPMSSFEKEERIVHLLNVYEEDLCYLNNIIKSRFPYHEAMHAIDENKRKEKAVFMFKKLISAIIETQVILLDDLQSLDQSSWDYIRLILNSPKIFTVFTLTRGKFTSIHTWLYSVLISSNIRKIMLGPLTSKWTAPLACQILDVSAVPIDLCNALRTKCKGMPGLVESFIVHLFSSGAIELKKISDDELGKWEAEDFQFPDPTLLQPQALKASDQEALAQLIQNEATGEITICVVTNKMELNTNIDVQNIDTLIMIEIDSLTPYQQLLLKIASAIGDVFSRDLLESIMYENNSLTTAKAIKRLFSMRLLSCANTRWPRNKSMISIKSSADVSANLTCECPFEYNPEDTHDLPKYAFCKIMRFKNKASRKACYELLPLNQKKEFHTRVVNCLEKQRLKCPDCGGSVMVVQSLMNSEPSRETISQDLSYGYGESDKTDSSENSSNPETTLQSENVQPISISDNSGNKTPKSAKPVTPFDDDKRMANKLITRKISSGSKISSRLSDTIANSSISEPHSHKTNSSKRVTMQSIYDKPMPLYQELEDRDRILEKIRAVIEANDKNDWQALGVYDSDDIGASNSKDEDRKSFRVNIEKNVSTINFSKCTCGELNVLIYEQLIYHAKQAELKIKTIEFLIKYSHLNITLSAYEEALPRLYEAETYCCAKQARSYLSKFDQHRFLGKLYTLRAYAHLQLGVPTLANLDMERASQIYHVNLKLHKLSDLLKLRYLKITPLWHKKYRIEQVQMKSDSVLCLNVATMIYSSIGDEKSARISALQAVEVVTKFECEFSDMCEAFSNAIQLCLEREMPETTAAAQIECQANNALRRLSRSIRADELCFLGKLLNATFKCRIARGRLAAAVRSGFRSIVISRFLRADSVSIEIIPDLFYVLLARRCIAEAIELVQETLLLARSRCELVYEVWYYALCIDLILDAGFQLESPMKITRFGEFVLVNETSESPGCRRLITGLWTYWLRLNSDLRASQFEAEALRWAGSDGDGSLTTMISSMRLAEGLLESLAHKVDDLRKVECL